VEKTVFTHEAVDLSGFGREEGRLYFESALGLTDLALWKLLWLACDDEHSVFGLVSILTGKTYVLVVSNCHCED